MLSATLVLIMVSLLAASAFPAAFTVNLVGKWEGKISGIQYDPFATPDMAYYKDAAIIIRVLDKNGDRFYGEVSTGGQPYDKFTGVISPLGMGVATSKNTVVAINMPVLEANYWRMTGHVQNSHADGQLNTAKFAVHRTSLTP